ncbi:MAG: hypothetical protein ACTSQI_04310 [Candidatus Helarchaeota archaeon]
MSSFEILEQYNTISRQLLDLDPKVRQAGVRKMASLYYEAPELKISVLSKLKQACVDSNEKVAKLAEQFVEYIESGRKYGTIYAPYRQTAASSTGTQSRTPPPQNMKNIAANIICCIIAIVLYFVFTYVIF